MVLMHVTSVVLKRVLEVLIAFTVLTTFGGLGSHVWPGSWDSTIGIPFATRLAPAGDGPNTFGVLTANNTELGPGEVLEDMRTTIVFPVRIGSRISVLWHVYAILASLAILLILWQLRRVASSVAQGAPFDPRNVGRIRAIGGVTITLELFRAAHDWALEAYMASTSTISGYALAARPHVEVAVLLLGLVILALAEVFRYGLQLQSDADLTV